MKIGKAAILACFVGVATLATPAFAAAATASTIESVTPTGEPSVGASPDGDFTPVELSSNGRYVAFMSYDGTLDAANPTTFAQVAYVRDRATGHTTLASVDGNGVAVGPATGIELSGDGRTLAFTLANNASVYVRNLATGTTRSVGSAPGGAYFSLDDDGGILVTGDANALIVHVYEAGTGNQITQFSGYLPSISGDGTHVVYRDVAPQQIVVLDLISGGRRVIGPGQGTSAISRDGRYVVFPSDANLVASGASSSCNAPGNSCPRLYRADTLTGVFQRVDVVSGGGDPVFAPFGGVNQSVGISADGQVAYFSSPGDFGLGSPPYQLLYAHDFASGRTVLASPPTPNGNTFINPSYPAPSQDGRLVAFLGQTKTPAGVLQQPQVYTTVPDFERLPDSTPPSVLVSLSPAPNGAGWNTSPVTVSFACSDADSGIASCPSPVVVAGEGANQVVTGTATDAAGNSASTSVAINLDETPPLVAVIGVTAGGSYPYGTATPGCQTTDPLSGVAVAATLTISGGSGGQAGAFTATCAGAIDLAGNTQSPVSVQYTVSKATPSITWATPASITYGTPLGAAQLNATASVPGSFSYSPSAGTVLQPGTRTLTVTFTPTNAADYTTATASVQISVGFTQNCITTRRTGPFVVASGQSTCVANGGSIVGPVTIQSGGSLWMSGGSITGPVNATGARALTLCGVRITGPVSVTGSIGYVLIGSPSTGCPGNVITGAVHLNQNTGGLGFSGNSVTGSVTITNNTGGYTYSGNAVTGQVIQVGNS
jgi:hypothetical protein